MSYLRSVSGALIFAFFTVLAHAQAPGEPARLARLNVIAVDNNGQPVTGLTAADFQVTDQGKPQPIILFRPAAAAAPAGAKELANRTAPGAHTTAILLDFMSENRTERQEAARRLGASIKQMESGELLYLYVAAPDGVLDPIHEIPKDPAAAGDKGWTKDIDKLLATAIKSHDKQRPAGLSEEDVVKKTYVNLEGIANQLAMFPGRRDIIWVTGWVPNVSNPKTPCNSDWIDCALYVPHLSVTLEHAGVMVNPIFYATANVDQSRILDEMGSLTGGRSYLGQDVHEVFKQFGSQAAGTYSIAYNPAASNWDSKFHKVKVTCSKPGVKLQARQRYYALPDQRPMPQRQQGLMVAAYQAAPDAADIGLRATLSKGASPNSIHVELRVDPADLMMHEMGGQWSALITLVYSTRAAAGPEGEPTLGEQELKLTGEQHAAARENGILISKDFPIGAATQKVRFIVLDRNSDSVGSLTLPVSR